MNLTEEIRINGSVERVWETITAIEHWQDTISGIKNIHILNKPDDGLVGLKWEETREMFGKEAKEVMWITEAVEPEYYLTRAESHGSVYETKVSVVGQGDAALLSMTFKGTPQTIGAKIASFLMKPLIVKSIKSAVFRDLADIKNLVEQES